MMDDRFELLPDRFDSVRSNVDESALLALFPKLLPGTLSMLFTDVVGSSRLKRTNPGAETKYFAEIKPRHDQLLKDEIEKAGGHVLNVIGDCFFAGFQSAKNAVLCARSIQEALEAVPIQTPLGPLRVRIGLHSGEPTLYRNPIGRIDLCGSDVDLAARLQTLADGDQVFLSEQIAILTRSLHGLRFHSHGTHFLRGVGDHEVIELVWANRVPKRPHGGSHEPMPFAQSDFVGRKAELEALTQAISKYRLVTLTGAGGLGKTRLAREVFLHAGDWPWAAEGAAFVALDQITSDTKEAVQDAMVLALKLDTTVSEGAGPLLQEEFQGGSRLLILDNCETAPKSVAGIVAELLAACPNLRVLATSQRALGLRQIEAVISLDPMAAPGAEAVSTTELAQLDSYQLFAAAARRADADWVLPAELVKTLVRILQLTDGIPLAIELVAAGVQYSSLQEIASDLAATPLGSITDAEAVTGPTTVSQTDRHQSLARCFQWSFDHLTSAEQAAFTKLGVFVESFTESAAAFVCGLDDSKIALAKLVNAGLVQRRIDTEPSRYFLLGMTRAFARLKAPEALIHDLDLRYVQFFHELARRSTASRETNETLSWEHDWPHLIAASQKAKQLGDPQAVWRISRALSPYLLQSGLWVECEGLNRAAVAAAESVGAVHIVLQALLTLARVLDARGKWREEAETLRRCADVPQRDRQATLALQAFALQRLGPLLMKLGRDAEAEAVLRELQTLTPRIEGSKARATSLDQEAFLLQARQRWSDAERKFRESLALRESEEDFAGIAHSHVNLGLHFMYRGDWDEAQVALHRGLREWARLGSARQEGIVLGHLGGLLRRQGRYAEAQAALEESLQLRSGDPKVQAVTLTQLARVLRLQHRLDEAELTVRKALELAESLNAPQAIRFAYNELGTLHEVQRKWPEAEAALDRSARRLSRDGNDPRGLAMTLERLARVHLRCGHVEKAKAVLEESISVAKRARQFSQAAATTMDLALALAAEGDKNGALKGLEEAIGMLTGNEERRLLTAAKDLRGRLGRQMKPGVPWSQWFDAAYSDQLIRIRKRYMPGLNEPTSATIVNGYKLLIQEFSDAGRMMEAAIAMNELGSACRRLPIPDFGQSEASIRSALTLFRELEIAIGQADSWHKLGDLFFAKKELAKSEEAYQNSLRLKRAAQNDLAEAITLDHLAEVYLAEDRLDEAEDAMKRAFEIIRSFGSAQQKWFPLRHLAELRERRGDLAGALEWARTAIKEVGVSRVGREAQELLQRLEKRTSQT